MNFTKKQTGGDWMDDIPDWWLYIGVAIYFFLTLAGFDFVIIFLLFIVVVSIVVNVSDRKERNKRNS